MRILTVTSSYPKFREDTTAPFIESITRELASRGHDITMVLPHRSDLRLAPLEGVRFRPYRYAPWASLERFGYAESLRADVAVRGAAYAALPLAVISAVRAIRQELRRSTYDAVHAHWVVPSGTLAALALGGASGPPLVVSLHGSDLFLAEKSRAARWGSKKAFHRAAAVTACSEDLASRSFALGAREPPEVIPYGVDTHLFRAEVPGTSELRQRLGIPPAAPVVLAVGRLVRKKGFEVLIDAAAELVRQGGCLELVIAGRGDLESELLSRAEARGLSGRMRLVGNVERGELPLYFAMAELVVVPSVRDSSGNVDGLPNVLLEAMAAQKAIVATSVGGIPQAARPGREAVLVPEKDPGALAGAISALLASTEARTALGARARKRAEEAFGWNRTGERFESVLRSVAQACRA